jgi:hypothetical protein
MDHRLEVVRVRTADVRRHQDAVTVTGERSATLDCRAIALVRGSFRREDEGNDQNQGLEEALMHETILRPKPALASARYFLRDRFNVLMLFSGFV